MGVRIRIQIIATVAGAMLGYVILSPFAMYITHEVHAKYPIHEMTLLEVFRPELLSWTIPFTLLGSLIGLAIGILYGSQSRAQDALQSAEERLRSIVESSEDIIVMQDLDGKYLYYNAPSKYGLTPEDLLGKTPLQVHGPELSAKITQQIKKVAETGHSLTFEEESSWGELAMWFHIQVSPIKDSHGNVVAATTILRNVTESKWAELGLKKYIKDLEEANQMKDLFTDIMTHDLLSPAGVIMNSAELLLDGAKDEDKELLETIDWGAKRQIEIIELASKLSKLESREYMEKKKLDLKDIIARVIRDVEPLFEKEGMRIENKLPPGASVSASLILEEVFLNLLTNAKRHAPDGEKVVIEGGETDDGYTVSITDFGPGIPDNSKEDIFNRFMRRKKESVRGTGLGLAIAKRVVELHDGRIWVEDNPRGGAVFKVYLPK
jgi:PAS domain S-box-containing protein